MKKTSRTSTPCPLCGQPSPALFVAHGWDILRCQGCGHQFATTEDADNHVGRVYSDEYFFGGGAGYSDYLSEADLLRERGASYARLLRQTVGVGSLLDVGAAAGFVLEGFLSEGWTGRGLEPNARMCALANERLGPSVDVGTLEAYSGEGRFDLVSMIQVVAHFSDPRRALARAAELTRPGGFWLVETWDRESWTARLLGRRWHEYSPPSVLQWFSRQGLRQLAESLGFREIAAGRPRRWIDLGHARSLLRHKIGAGAWRHALLPLRLVPASARVPYPGDDLFWALFRDERGSGPRLEACHQTGGPSPG